MILIQKKILFLFFIISFLFSCGSDVDPGTIEGSPRSSEAIYEQDLKFFKTKDKLLGSNADDRSQILFGDLHVHTTYSIDAFTLELPMMGLQGIHDSSMACDFARYCANLDFFSFNDHAESLTPDHWREQKEIVKQCNISNSDPVTNDLVVFPGWEWTQIGTTKDNHWGHRNVIFKDIQDLPARPIGSRTPDSGLGVFDTTQQAVNARWLDLLNFKRYSDLDWLLNTVRNVPFCEEGIASKELPIDCYEYAKTPRDLFNKLDEWDSDSIVIPHGQSWGFHVPLGTSWNNRLNFEGHDSNKQILLEIMSGHGNSEEYRDISSVNFSQTNNMSCPEPTDDFLPCCWQAGEIQKQRCDGLSNEECDARVELAKQYTLLGGPYTNMVFPEAKPEEWLNCDQCTDCFKPAFNYRPKQSAQYALAISNFNESQDNPKRYNFGFIASTDDHTARPGTGYKQYERRKMTFATGVKSKFWEYSNKAEDPNFPEIPKIIPGESQPDSERVSSFVYPGGILAVHSEGRGRDQIWSALKNKNVYGTSGPRILLWFDLTNSPVGKIPMGSEIKMSQNPSFEVKAAGSFKQNPGCSGESIDALSSERLEYLCAGECYNPSNERHTIKQIEVIKITPQSYPGEAISSLIQDPWKVIPCNNAEECTVRFEDESYNRDSIYYVRAIQEETLAINGSLLTAREDFKLCKGSFRTELNDNCLSMVNERAWSSPIYINKP
ncbi:PF12228 domain protein [SAR86 cluster bacterium SAR86E]|uniref:PF12228 domain protein n=1 Tax=SAR86 cluster bacterium SAR86E TaxID=1208365 RepID=K6GFW1_9GAMM|nr:PF12228 domain protein [SAR86 cluster bacterium SAR86E]